MQFKFIDTEANLNGEIHWFDVTDQDTSRNGVYGVFVNHREIERSLVDDTTAVLVGNSCSGDHWQRSLFIALENRFVY